MTILATAFPPISNWKQNSSEILLRSLEEFWPDELKDFNEMVQLEMLPGDSRKLKKSVSELIKRHNPDYCLFLGQNVGSSVIMLERRAKNFLDKPYPRNSFQPCVIEEGAPSFLQSSFQHFEILERDLQSAKIPTCFSDDAGGSLCNQVYYHALNYSQSNSLQIQSTFVHLPLLPEQVKEQFFNKPFMTLETMRESFVIMVRAICTAKSSLQ